MPRYYYYIILTALAQICITGISNAQACISTDTLIIIDNDKANVNFTVDGVINDDLASSTQCVKAVSLRFRHGDIGDLSVNLISPDGASVQLIGPVGSAANTQLVNWDVTFIPCVETAMPDPDIADDVWSNDANWRTLENYRGSYYPYRDCLEDFITGSVNGIWTVEIADEIAFDAGEIEYIGIEFCDEAGIGCEPCMASAGQFTNSLDTTICVFDNNLLLDFLDIEGATDPTDLRYRYEFVIADEFNREIFDVNTAPDVRSYGAADFEICGLSYDASFESEIRQMASEADLDDFKRFIDQVPSSICADITSQCIKIKTLNIVDTLFLDTVICSGSLFEFNGEFFFEEGQVLVPFGRATCDSIAKINIELVEIESVISSTASSLTCDIDTIFLGGGESVVTPDFQRAWSGPPGAFVGNPAGPQIRVFEPGEYQLIVFNTAGCADTSTINIANDKDALLIDDINTSGELTCAEPEISLQIIIDELPTRVEWTGPEGFFSEEVSPNVVKAGMYTALVFGSNGCSATDSVLVERDSTIVRYNFEVDTLSCMISEVDITFNDTIFPIDPLWISPSGVEFAELSPSVTEAGIYRFVASSFTGCRDTQLYEVVLFSETYGLEFVDATLSCTADSAMLQVLSDNDIIRYQWTGPNEYLSLEEAPMVSDPGLYTVRTIDINNCPGLDSFEIMADTIAPMIVIIGDNLQCMDSATTLNLIIDEFDAAFEWSGPLAFSSLESSVSVSNEGQYIVEAVGNNGCSRRDTFELIREAPFNVEIIDNTFACDFNPISINASAPPDAQRIIWEGPNEFTSNELNPTIIDTGLYTIYVLGSDDCEVRDSAYIGIPESTIEISNVSDTVLTCEIIDITLNPTVSAGVSDVVWITPSLTRILELSPNVTEAGTYLLEVRDNQGCIADTSLVIGLDTMSPTISTSIIGNFVCERDQVTIDGSESASGSDILYQWTTSEGDIISPSNQSVIEVGIPGSYIFNVLNLNNLCVSSKIVEVEEQANQFTTIELDIQSESCSSASDGSVQVISTEGAADGPLELSLDNMQFSVGNQITGLAPGSYIIYVKDFNGCLLEREFTIDSAVETTLSLGDDRVEFQGESFIVGLDTTGIEAADLVWLLDGAEFAMGIDSITVSSRRDVIVSVELITENGCFVTDEILIDIEERKALIYAPNVFMPGTNENGVFRLFPNQAIRLINEFYVFDRWGNQVHAESNLNPTNPYGWDGSFNGQAAESGVYGFKATYTLTNERIRQISGTVTLVR